MYLSVRNSLKSWYTGYEKLNNRQSSCREIKSHEGETLNKQNLYNRRVPADKREICEEIDNLNI